jgi:hypothetical protein
MRHPIVLGVLLIAGLSGLSPLPSHAWNQLPLLAESPAALPAGQVEAELGVKFLGRKNFPFSRFSKTHTRNVLSVPTLGLKFGLGQRTELQLSYEVLCVEEEEFRIREQWKSGDLAVFTKIALLAECRRWPALGLRIGAKLPNSDRTYRVGTDETDLAFSTLFAKTVAPLTMTAHLGLLILGNPYKQVNQDDLLEYGLACAMPWKSHFTWVAEIAGQAFGTAYNQRSTAALHWHFHDGAVTWTLSGRAGLVENSAAWGISASVRRSFHLNALRQ